MKITNSEYGTIVKALEVYSDTLRHIADLQGHHAIKDEADTLRDKLRKEYNEIAERNLAEGMSKEEEEVYPSRLYSEYGGEPIGDREVE